MKDQPAIGTLLNPGKLPNRDAIHVAILPIIAGARLHRGEPFRIKRGTKNIALSGEYNGKYSTQNRNLSSAVGIIDPYLSTFAVQEGEACYGFMYPNTITGLHHHWEHPIVDSGDSEREINEHEQWLIGFAEDWNFDYDQLIDAATGNSNYVVALGIDLHSADDLGAGVEQEFWEHIEGLTGKEISESHKKDMVWSCSC